MIKLKYKKKKKLKKFTKTLKTLVDHGSSSSLVAQKAIGSLSTYKSKKTSWNTTAGSFLTNGKTDLNIKLSELSETAAMNHQFNVSQESLGQCDMIIGRNLANTVGLDTCGSDQTIKWPSMNAEVPHKRSDLNQTECYMMRESDGLTDKTKRMSRALDAKHSKADPYTVAKNVKTLNDKEQKCLEKTLKNNESLFDGTLGRWVGKPYEIKLKEGSEPFHAKAFPVPQAYEKTLKMEMQRLAQMGVLKRVNHSECASPSFTMPKKDRTVRFINDFGELNKRVKRTPYPIPNIQDMLLKLQGFTFATSLDLNMGHYHVELHPDSKKLCTLVFPWGKYEMQVLPMGLCNEPDIFQEKMSALFQELECVRTHIDDLLVTTKGDLEDHLEN